MPAPVQPTSIRLPRPLKQWLERDSKTEQRRLSVHIVYILTRYKLWRDEQVKK